PVAWEAGEVFEAFCVFNATVAMPVFQQGAPPFNEPGSGAWRFDEGGALIARGEELANVGLTIPRRAMPAGGFPVAAVSRTGGGGERPLVDRGVRAEAGGEAVEPGSGPALEFARVGVAGISVDGPHGGRRNVTQGDEQFLIFKIDNPVAMRDNIRQSAL